MAQLLFTLRSLFRTQKRHRRVAQHKVSFSAISSTPLGRLPLILCSRLSHTLSGVTDWSLRRLRVQLDCPDDRVMLESMAYIRAAGISNQ